jgi:cell division septum initiation protein DivIVA
VVDNGLGERGPGSGAEGRLELAEILEELVGLVERAKSMPLSSSAIIGREEVLELLNAARETLPTEFQRARRVIQERDEVRARAMREADELLDEARAQAAHMVQRTEIVRQARNNAERILADAEAESRRIRHEADDYVDRKLAAFEIVLDRTIRTVQAGRDRLSVNEGDNEADEIGEMDSAEDAFFDQDRQ